MSEKLYYCYEEQYPFFIRILQNGESVPLPLDQYCREFTLDPNNIMLTRKEFQKRLAKLKEKPAHPKSVSQALILWDEVSR